MLFVLLTAAYSAYVHASPIRDEREARESASALDEKCHLPTGHNLGLGRIRVVSEEQAMFLVPNALAALQIDTRDVKVMIERLGEVRLTYYDTVKHYHKMF